MLPEINRRLREAGSTKRYKNLLGVTLGTGFGAGVVIEESFCGVITRREICMVPAEQEVPGVYRGGERQHTAVMRVYAERSGDAGARTPKEIFRDRRGYSSG